MTPLLSFDLPVIRSWLRRGTGRLIVADRPVRGQSPFWCDIPVGGVVNFLRSSPRCGYYRVHATGWAFFDSHVSRVLAIADMGLAGAVYSPTEPLPHLSALLVL